MKLPLAQSISVEETHYQLMRLIEAHPGISQRDAANKLGVSLGKINYSLRALMEKGLVKVANFKNSKNKAAYRYLLTPRGIEEKTKLALQFMQMKMREYERLRAEIKQIRLEAGSNKIDEV